MIRRIFHIVLTAFAIITLSHGAYASLTPERIYHDSLTRRLSDTIISLTSADNADIFKAIEVRGRFDKKTAGRSGFGAAWAMEDSGNYSFALIRPTDADHSDDLYSPPRLLLSVGHTENGVTTDLIPPLEISKAIDPNGGDNSLAVEISDKEIRILVGSRQLNQVASLPSSAHDLSGASAVIARGNIDFSLIVTESTPDPRIEVASSWTPETIDSYFMSDPASEPPEGIWIYLDRNNDPDFARPGGDYRLAIVRSTDSPGFDIIYLSGASVGSRLWTPGMKKGHLSPTTFSGHYNLTWFDSTMQRIDSECSASLEASSTILRLDFPLLKSSMRFSLLPQGR